MPYIKKEDRRRYLYGLQELSEQLAEQPKGHLNYVLSILTWEWIKSITPGYTTISEGIGAMLDAASELRRRKLDPYEDEKIKENGDVYEDVDLYGQGAFDEDYDE